MIKITETTTIEVADSTLELLDIVKRYNPNASYNDTIIFLIGQYSLRLEELQLADVNNKVLMGNTEDGEEDE